MGKTLPNNWVDTELGNILDIITNGINIEQLDCPINDKSLPISRIETIANETIDFNRVKYCDPTQEQHNKYLIAKGDILFSHINSDKHLGKTAIYNSETPLIHGVNLLRLRSYEYIYNSFLLNYVFKYLRMQGAFIDIAQRAVNQSSINQKKLNNVIIPLPPLPEQERIANKLDALFVQLDTVRTAMERIPTLLKNFRQQVLTQAVTGKLTEEWREDKELEDVSSIIENIRKRRIKENKNKNTELVRIASVYSDQSSSIDFDFFDEWIEVNLDKVCSKFAYGTSSKSENFGKYPVIRMGNLQNGKIDWSDLKYTSDEKEYKKYGLRKGDILFNRTNSPELVGKTAIYDGKYDSIYAGYLIKIFNYEELDSRYLNIVMNTQYAKRWCWDNKTDGVSQSNINAQKLSKFTIPFPGPNEQQEIVHRVESLFSQANVIEQQYLSLKQKTDNLPQAILHKAFKGELVEQLPTDGDARDLLRQIEELKQSTKKKK